FLVVVEFLEREDRQVDVVLFEPEQARRVMHQDIRVENEKLRRGRGAGLGRLAGREQLQRGRCGAQLGFDHVPPTERASIGRVVLMLPQGKPWTQDLVVTYRPEGDRLWWK